MEAIEVMGVTITNYLLPLTNARCPIINFLKKL
jgi:hypothetical protein